MDSAEAYKLVENVGYAYFYDEVHRFSIDEILSEIQEDVQQTQLRGLDFWENRRDAFKLTLSECSDQDIRVLLQAFAQNTLTVEQGRRFLTRVYETMVQAIETHDR